MQLLICRLHLSACNVDICLFGYFVIYLMVTVCLSEVNFSLLLALCQLSPRQPDTRATNSTPSRVSRRHIKPHHAPSHFTSLHSNR